MSPEDVRDYIFGGLAVLVLLAFVWLFGRDLWSTFSSGKQPDPSKELEDPVLYVATAVAGLVGAVSAAFLGVEAATESIARGAEWQVSDYIRVAYVIVYLLFGATAVVAWVNKKGQTPVSIRNLAVTFVGITIAAVGAYLGVKANLID